MKKSMRTRGQMSEAVSTGIFLTLSGGFQDAYTYYCRGNVFANAQTGNIVLMGSHLAAREWAMAVRYLAPVLAFAGGVYMAEHVKRLHRQDRRFHWRQLIVAIEITLLFAVGFLPQSMNMAANIIVSFVCALQVNAFRKIKGSPLPPPCASETCEAPRKTCTGTVTQANRTTGTNSYATMGSSAYLQWELSWEACSRRISGKGPYGSAAGFCWSASLSCS